MGHQKCCGESSFRFHTPSEYNDAIRITNYFKLQDKVKVYANIGTHGIDGCMSSLLGQAAVTDELCFLVIGDLAFFMI